MNIYATFNLKAASIFLAALIFFSSLPASAQKFDYPYKYRYSTEITFGTVGAGTLLTGYLLGRKKEGLSVEQIKALNRNDIWIVDRSATNRWSHGSALASDVLMYTSLALPSLLLINDNIRKNQVYNTGVIYVEALLLNAGLTELTKVLAGRTRPYVYNENAPSEKKTDKDAVKSFFSGHTSFSATSTFFMAQVFSDFNPHSKYKPYVWTAAALVPLATGILRYTAGKHFLTDILVGYATGAAVGILVPYLHRKTYSRL